jgi:hypothetical protein
MPVDRARRDDVAGALASFLRGETGRDEFRAALRGSVRPHGRRERGPDKDTCLETLADLWFCGKGGHGPIPEECWRDLCRYLAFLKSDLEERPWQGSIPSADEDRPRQILLARWHALALLAAAGVAYLTSRWVFFAATPVSFALYMAATPERKPPVDGEQERRRQESWDFFPFADRAEWLAHQHLLDSFRLPAYDPARFDGPRRGRKWPPFLKASARVARGGCIAAAFAYVCAGSVLIWPVWVVLMSLQSPGTGAADKVRPE